MLLASVAEILERLGFDVMPDITNSVTFALDSATEQIAAILDTDFTQGTYTDTFYVEKPPYRVQQATSTEFRLRRGLVSSLTSVLAAYNVGDFNPGSPPLLPTYWANNQSISQQSDTPINVTPNVVLDGDRGVCKDFQNNYKGMYVQITYVSGFAVSGNSYLAVPDWLQQAAKLKAMMALANDPSLEEAQIKIDVKVLAPQFNSLISRKLRYAPIALLPM